MLGQVEMRIAVISPFLDRHHGTERCIIEQLERFPIGAENEIHIYAQRIQDLQRVVRYKSGAVAISEPRLFWHRVLSIPGPYLVRYLFWFCANTICRWWDACGGLDYDLVYSPGINAADADAIAVHAVFHEFSRGLHPQLGFRGTPMWHLPRLIHRRLYYRLIIALEKQIYRRSNVSLSSVSGLVAAQLNRQFQRQSVRVIHHGVDTGYFSICRRVAARPTARQRLGLTARDFTLLLIGNDLKTKGLDALLQALAELRGQAWKLLVVGSDVPDAYENDIRGLGVGGQILFLPPSPDVLQFYAAADAYIGPSLEDAYGMPVLEAMACGLPVICSATSGVSEIITGGIDGLVLSDPQDVTEIASALQCLISSPDLCIRLGRQAAITAQQHSWDTNAHAAWKWLCEVAQAKNRECRVGR